MVVLIDKIARNLAHNIIGLRKKRNLTQEGLAKLAGATRGSVALIESGQSNPTLEVLLKISQALQVSIDELLGSPKAECRHIRANEIPLDRRSKHGVVLRKLLPDKIGATEMDEISLEPNATMTGSPHVEGTREYFTCIDGQVTIGVLGQVFQLKKGDVLSFPGDKPHSYKNQWGRKARGVSVVIFNPVSWPLIPKE